MLSLDKKNLLIDKVIDKVFDMYIRWLSNYNTLLYTSTMKTQIETGTPDDKIVIAFFLLHIRIPSTFITNALV